MVFPVILILLVIALYIVVMCVLYSGLVRLYKPGDQKPEGDEMVCVVVPFRDEAENLQDLINDLSSQTYPEHLLSVILVNDHSTDQSLEIASRLTESLVQFRCLDLPVGLHGKKAAISHAISRTRSPWILQTDADCRMESGFVSSHMSFLEDYPSDLVAGMVTTGKGTRRFLSAFERLDILGISGAGAGSYHQDRPLMCSGANLGYSRDLYLEAGRYHPGERSPSGDDMFLLIAARKLGKRISFNGDHLSLVTTVAVSNWRSLVKQRIRWGGKSGLYRMWDIQILALLVALTTMAVLFMPVWMIQFPESWAWLVSATVCKLMIDFLILSAMTGRTRQRSSLWWYIPVQIAYYPYMTLVIMGSLLIKPVWKERETK